MDLCVRVICACLTKCHGLEVFCSYCVPVSEASRPRLNWLPINLMWNDCQCSSCPTIANNANVRWPPVILIWNDFQYTWFEMIVNRHHLEWLPMNIPNCSNRPDKAPFSVPRLGPVPHAGRGTNSRSESRRPFLEAVWFGGTLFATIMQTRILFAGFDRGVRNKAWSHDLWSAFVCFPIGCLFAYLGCLWQVNCIDLLFCQMLPSTPVPPHPKYRFCYTCSKSIGTQLQRRTFTLDVGWGVVCCRPPSRQSHLVDLPICKFAQGPTGSSAPDRTRLEMEWER